jgi:hypothetical protein
MASSDLQAERRKLEFRLIEIEAKIDALTPKTITDHMDRNRTRFSSDRELRLLEGDRDAAKKQLLVLDIDIAAASAKKQPSNKKVTLKQKTFDRVEDLKQKHPDLDISKLLEKVAEEESKEYDAIKKRYYDHLKDDEKKRGQTGGKRTDGKSPK